MKLKDECDSHNQAWSNTLEKYKNKQVEGERITYMKHLKGNRRHVFNPVNILI